MREANVDSARLMLILCQWGVVETKIMRVLRAKRARKTEEGYAGGREMKNRRGGKNKTCEPCHLQEAEPSSIRASNQQIQSHHIQIVRDLFEHLTAEISYLILHSTFERPLS